MNLSLLPLNDDLFFRVRCTGPVSLRGLPHGTDPLQTLLGPNCYAHKILLNLEGTQSLDTSGVAWLVRTHNAFTQGGGQLVLYSVPPTVLDVLDFLRMKPLFHLAVDEATALDLVRDLSDDAGRPETDGAMERLRHLRAI
jgi:anti-anti-sigma factor